MDRRQFLRSIASFASLMVLKKIPLHGLDRVENSSQMIPFHRAKFYEKIADGIIQCLLCPHHCKLQKDQIGICRTRISDGNDLYTLAYNNPIALHLDPIEKKPLYHFFPTSKILSLGTAGCNFRCLNCQNYSISQVSPRDVSSLNYTPEQIVNTAIELNVKFIAYTYTEPTVFYEYMYDIAKLAHAHGIKNVMITNGYIEEEPLNQLLENMDAFNIDLKSFNKQTYRKLCGGDLDAVLRTIKKVHQSKRWLEITNLMVTDYTDNLDEFSQMIDWLLENGFAEVPLHISRFFPAYKLSHSRPTDISIIKKARQIAIEKKISYVYTGNIPGDEGQNTYCPSCKSLLIERNYYNVRLVNISNGACLTCGQKIPGVWK
ncbi:MAG: AmmeMemoRadiSam system radical SAM enzyme [Bacteroidales bacterium]|nr:AmmeMemoRadiSam system radical SAM enzyme [Bacteroidales bacterium]